MKTKARTEPTIKPHPCPPTIALSLPEGAFGCKKAVTTVEPSPATNAASATESIKSNTINIANTASIDCAK